MFTYSGKFRASGAHNETPAEDLETAKLRIEEIACLALVEFVGPIVVEQIELVQEASAASAASVAAQKYIVEIVLHSPDHSTLLRREMLASARRHIDSTLRPLLTELFGRVRQIHTTLAYADCDADWGEVNVAMPTVAPVSVTGSE